MRKLLLTALLFPFFVHAEQLEDDAKSTKTLHQINQSVYQYDVKSDFNFFMQFEQLPTFFDHPKISEKTNRLVKDTYYKIYQFMNALSDDGYPDRFVVVNIPSYQLIAFEYNQPVFQSKVVVGKPKTPTPFKKINITSLKYNPNWTPTPNMIKRLIKKADGIDIEYLRSHDLVAYENGVEVPYEEIEPFGNYVYRQPSGVNNALGVLKFETDSKDNIYLHDTNQPHLFKNKSRAYSSGCVRVQNYLDLASWLVYGDQENVDKIQKNIYKEKTYFQRVEKVPVYFTYFRVGINDNNKIITFSDPYKLPIEEIELIEDE